MGSPSKFLLCLLFLYHVVISGSVKQTTSSVQTKIKPTNETAERNKVKVTSSIEDICITLMVIREVARSYIPMFDIYSDISWLVGKPMLSKILEFITRKKVLTKKELNIIEKNKIEKLRWKELNLSNEEIVDFIKQPYNKYSLLSPSFISKHGLHIKKYDNGTQSGGRRKRNGSIRKLVTSVVNLDHLKHVEGNEENEETNDDDEKEDEEDDDDEYNDDEEGNDEDDNEDEDEYYVEDEDISSKLTSRRNIKFNKSLSKKKQKLNFQLDWNLGSDKFFGTFREQFREVTGDAARKVIGRNKAKKLSFFPKKNKNKNIVKLSHLQIDKSNDIVGGDKDSDILNHFRNMKKIKIGKKDI